MLLIVSNRGDATVDYACRIFERDRLEYRRLDTDLYPAEIGLEFDSIGTTLHLPDGRLDLETITSVWWRRPVPPLADEADDKVAIWAASEAHAALDAALRGIDPVRFVNHPDANRAAERKPLVLRHAAEHGLGVPEWVVSNTPGRARTFFDEVGPDVIAKPLVSGRVDDTRSFWTTRLSRSDADAVGPEPYLLQRFILRDFDVRVTSFDRECVGVRIDARGDDAEADWRRAGAARTSYEQCDVPPQERRALLALVSGYGLRFCTADFAVDSAGRWWFLELNPNGQWAWLDEHADVDLAGELVKLLRP